MSTSLRLPKTILLALTLGSALPGLGCNETALNGLISPNQRGSELDDDDAADDDDLADDDDATNPIEEPPDTTPPPRGLDGCPDDALYVTDFWGPDGEDQLVVMSWGPTEGSATLLSPIAGLFDLYDSSAAESGPGQTNETGFVRVRNDENPEGTPALTNCGLDWLVLDTDNEGPPPALVYLGTFELTQGENALTLYHFCPLFRQGYCGEFHIGPSDSGTGCAVDGPNSLHLILEGLCLVPR